MAGAKKTYQRLFYRYRELVAGVLGFVQRSLHHYLQLGELQPSFREFGYANQELQSVVRTYRAILGMARNFNPAKREELTVWLSQ